MGPASSPLITYVLRLADDNLVLGQQLGALISRMPELEEDIAVANIAIDHIGQARNLYQYVTELEAAVGSEDESSPRSEDDVGSRAAARSEDDLAMLRSERE
ncbi:MAG: phenylacetate-CoA oxygenase subunit PaaI, partial [Acidimicrobiia bacterium]|nr:phenylacetate-CoA oxygenase subunit PaaI [Acidimicrobiia bacterium]